MDGICSAETDLTRPRKSGFVEPRVDSALGFSLAFCSFEDVLAPCDDGFLDRLAICMAWLRTAKTSSLSRDLRLEAFLLTNRNGPVYAGGRWSGGCPPGSCCSMTLLFLIEFLARV